MSTINLSNKSKAPSFIAYHVRDSKDGKSFFNRIGAAWSHADGKGFSIQMDAFPVDGRITLRANEEPNAE